MSEKRISYLDKNFDDYKNSLLDISRQYYGDLFKNFNDASVGSWFLDMFSDIADNLSYHIDRTYQETSVNSANETDSLLNIARNHGVKIPGPKSAIVEVEISCELPLIDTNQRLADENYAPYIKKGTLFSTGSVMFELENDVDFKKQFDENGMSDRQIIPNRDPNGNIITYTYKKLAIARSGQSKIYKKVITSEDIKPFMSILLTDDNILNVESIILKDSKNSDLNTDPKIEDFYVDEQNFYDREGRMTRRFFEVDNLAEQYRFGIDFLEGEDYYNPVYQNVYSPVYKKVGSDYVLENDEYAITESIVKGKWKKLKNKFITEFTNNWGLKVIFGSGLRNVNGTIPNDAKLFTQHMMSRMEANDFMGVLPDLNHTMYVLYRVGGGSQTNIAKNTLNYIVYLNMDIDGVPCIGTELNAEDAKKKNSVKKSIKVTNTSPSYGGKDSPSNEELKYLIKCNSGANNRCVTLRDYESAIMNLPPKFGTPFRSCAMEQNNKVIIYTLGLTSNGKLSNLLSETASDNIKEYLEKFRMINDFVELYPGKIFNIGFDIDIFIDRSYDRNSVIKSVIETVYDYMDIRNHMMGEDVFLGDLEKEISKIDGVINLIDLRCYNKIGGDYSNDVMPQSFVEYLDIEGQTEGENEIDLKESDKTLFSEMNSMFEIKKINGDIRVNAKIR